MATLEQLQDALIKADAYGNVDDARAFADEIRKMRGTQVTPEPSMMDSIKQGAGNLVAGAVRGAGSIGATILAPYDMAKDAINGKGLSLQSNNERRQQIDAGLQSMGAEPDSMMYKGGKLAGEIAGTAGVGNALSIGAKGLGAAPIVVNALRTSGMTTGGGQTLAKELATRAGAGALVGGVSAGMVSPEDAGMGAAIGGGLPVVGKVVGVGAGAIGKSLRGGEVAPEVANLYQKAQQYGVDIPADRIANSKPMNALASALNYVPFSGRAATEQKMNSQLNQALSRTFGQNSPNVTMALRKAEGELGAKFDSVLKSNVVKIDKQFADDVTNVFKTAKRELSADALKPIKNQIQELVDKSANGVIDGQAAYNIKKTLDRLGRGSGNEAFHARELKNSLMGALDRSLGTTEAAAFAETRKQYGNMLSLQNLAKNGAEGEISVARLANMKNINNPEMQDIADIAAQFVKPREGAHGAAQRAAAGGITFGLAGAPALAAGAVSGRLANNALNSNVAKRFVLNQSPQANRLSDLLLQGGYRTAPVLSAQ